MDYTKIASYELISGVSGIHNSSPQLYRFIILNSEVLYHGIVIKVSLHFRNTWDSWLGANIGYLDNTDLYAPKLHVWLRLSEYQYYYDLIRQEKPVYFGYLHSDTTSPLNVSQYITQFEVISHTEPTGEGDQDANSRRPVLRLQRPILIPNEIQEMLSNMKSS